MVCKVSKLELSEISDTAGIFYYFTCDTLATDDF